MFSPAPILNKVFYFLIGSIFMNHIHSLIICISVLSAIPSVWAQLPSDLRSEQIFLAPEQTHYNPGDTIRTEGIVTCLSNENLAPYSRYVYIELISGGRNTAVRQKVACDDRGYFRADIPTDTLTSEGEYWLRAYTRLMRNFSSESFAHQEIAISNSPALSTTHSKYHDIGCNIAVSGRKLVEGIPQNIIAAIRSDDGTPLADIPVSLIASNNDTLSTAKSSASGYVSFNVMPKVGEHYSLSVSTPSGTQNYEVPDVEPHAVKIHGVLNRRKLNYEIAGDVSKAKDLHLYIYDHQNGFSHISSPPVRGSIQLDIQPEVVTMFLADDSCSVISEFSLSQKAPENQPIIMPQEFDCGEAIYFRIENVAQDSLQRIITRILPADDVMATHAEQALCYNADFRSDLPFPVRSYSGSYGESVADLSAWLSTAQFKRFTLKDAIELSDSAIYHFMPETGLTLNGTARRYEKYPIKKGSVVAYDGDSFATYDVQLTKDGRFTIPVYDFEDGCEFMLQYINTAGVPELVDLTLDNDSFPAIGNFPKVSVPSSGKLYRSGFDIDESTEMSRLLPDVVVKTRVKSEQNTSTRSYYAIRMKDREMIERRSYRTLLDILRDMPLLRVRNDSQGNWSIKSTRGASILGDKKPDVSGTMKNKTGVVSEIALIVDGSRYDPEMFGLILGMPADDIESVEQLAPYEALAIAAFAIDGAVVVTTRTAIKPNKRKSRGAICRPMGLTMAKSIERRLTAPSTPGKYRLQIDVVTKDGVRSLERQFTVK